MRLHEILGITFVRSVVKSLPLRSATRRISKGIIILVITMTRNLVYQYNSVFSKFSGFLDRVSTAGAVKIWHEPWSWALYYNQNMILFLANTKKCWHVTSEPMLSNFAFFQSWYQFCHWQHKRGVRTVNTDYMTYCSHIVFSLSLSIFFSELLAKA